jgi:hypothetical protein
MAMIFAGVLLLIRVWREGAGIGSKVGRRRDPIIIYNQISIAEGKIRNC